MAIKLSQIVAATSAPAPTDQFVGVKGGTTDNLFSLAQLVAGTPVIVSAAGTHMILPTDYGDVLVTTTGAVIVVLPDSTVRGGAPCSVVAIIATPAITITPHGTQTIMGLTSFPLSTPFGGITLWPLATGGWYQK